MMTLLIIGAVVAAVAAGDIVVAGVADVLVGGAGFGCRCCCCCFHC